MYLWGVVHFMFGFLLGWGNTGFFGSFLMYWIWGWSATVWVGAYGMGLFSHKAFVIVILLLNRFGSGSGAFGQWII